MKTWLYFRRTSRLIIAIVALYCTGPKTYINGCDLISTCYRCKLPSSEVDTYAYVNTADDCLALLNSSALYKTATYDASSKRCERGSTNERLLYDSATTKVTFRKTCNSDCLTYRWTFSDDREFYYTPSGQTNETRSICLVRCAETTNCRMLHHKSSAYYGNTCGWKTTCGTTCSTKVDMVYNIYKRWCYTGVDCGLYVPPVTNGNAYYADTRQTDEGSRVSYSCNIGYEKANSNVRTCMADGNWSTAEFTCNIKDCGGLSDTDGVWTYTTTTYGSSATLTCNTGYEIRRPSYYGTYGSTQTVTCTCCSSNLAYWNRGYYCSIVQCSTPYVPGGSVSYTTTTYGSTAVYTCDVGYDLTSGDSVRVCTANGNWDKTAPTCSIVECGLPALPLNGSVSVPLTTYGEIATFTCDDGFDIIGPAVIECNATGMWNDMEPACEIKDCGSPPFVIDGTLNYVTTTYASAAVYTCDDGYTLTGDSVTVCDASGLWDPPAPTCKIDCGPPSPPLNGTVHAPVTTHLNLATFTCDAGFDLFGPSVLECNATGLWNDTEPTCEIKDCGPPPSVIDGSVNCTTTTYASAAVYTCDVGYTLTGDIVTVCDASGLWDPPAPTCKIDCGPPSSPLNGTANAPATTYLELATFTCDAGFDLFGPGVIECNANGLWNDTEPTCEIKDCGPPPSVIDGTVNYTTTTYASTAVYTCDVDYTLTGDSVTVCDVSGLWDPPAPTCKIDCGLPTPVIDGTVNYTTTTYVSAAVYACNTGYTLTGDSVIVCNASGLWNVSAPICKIDCGPPSTPLNGSVSAPLTTYGATATFTCDAGFDLIGPAVLECNATGLWNDTEPTCEQRDCGPPSTPLNGSVSAPLTTYGATATFTCDAGFDLIGPAVLECNATGLWNDTEPTCEQRASLPCDIQWASPVSRHYHKQTTAQPDYTLISTTSSRSIIHCVTLCNAHARTNCVSGNGCRLFMSDQVTRECSMYFLDTMSGITVGCDASRVCYHK